jgi:endonuclease/exonuclease/phosphatase (EEP) superfamily protein YafD
VLNIVLWVVVVALIGVGVVRTWGAGTVGFGAVASAAMPATFVLTWPVGVFALVEHEWFLLAAATSLAGCQVAWLYPRRRGRRSRFPIGTDPVVTVFIVNAYFRNPDAQPIAGEIAANDADVVIILELSPAHVATLLASGVLAAYRWNLVLPDTKGAWGIGLWSKVPVVDLEPWDLQGVPQLRGQLQLAGNRSLGIVATHVPAPWPGPARRWVAGLAELGHAVGLETRPLVVAGDLNATWDHRPFRDLMSTGLRDAAVEAGRGGARTWPNDWRLVPPFLRLDHILVSRDVAVAGYRTGPGQGSDHRSVIAELAVSTAEEADEQPRHG